MGKKAKNKFYAYLVGSERGIVSTWAECEALTKGRPARYRGFATATEAQKWLDGGAIYESKPKRKRTAQQDLPENAVYFDAGTGRGKGVEVRVTDRDGTPLTWMALEEGQVTREGNLRLKGRTNNFGELTGLRLALEIAKKTGKRTILGDSRLVIDFWSKGYISKKKREEDPDMVALAMTVKGLRQAFEASGGEVGHVSGDLNPADLGFHR